MPLYPFRKYTSYMFIHTVPICDAGFQFYNVNMLLWIRFSCVHHLLLDIAHTMQRCINPYTIYVSVCVFILGRNLNIFAFSVDKMLTINISVRQVVKEAFKCPCTIRREHQPNNFFFYIVCPAQATRCMMVKTFVRWKISHVSHKYMYKIGK